MDNICRFSLYKYSYYSQIQAASMMSQNLKLGRNVPTTVDTPFTGTQVTITLKELQIFCWLLESH